MEQIKNKKNLILSIILAIVIAIVSFITLPIKVVHASVDYSNVLDDLKGSDNFIESDYPANDNDYSVKLLTIAESDYNELFLYVYQPSALRYSFTCNKVSMSLGFSPNGQNLKPELYDLKLVSNSGVFFKYVVIGFEPPKDDCHYFNIVALYRNSNALLEGSIVGGTTNGKALKVGEQWCCYAENGVMHYEKSTFRTVEMEPVMNGSVDLKEGSKLKEFLGINSGHKILFLAFTVDNFKVKHIYDAELNYQYRYVKYAKTVSSLDFTGQHAIESYTYSEDGDDYNNYDKYYDKSVKLTDKQTYSYQGKGLCRC